MGNKIIVEFDRKEIEKNCNRYFCLDCEKHCKQTDKDLIRCYLNWNDFKIKEQNNGNKETED